MPDTAEIFAASFVPDCCGGTGRAGRVTEAEPLADALERNGQWMNRAWMSAVGARCRAMVSPPRVIWTRRSPPRCARWSTTIELPMPFERARTLLLLSQFQRRQRDPACVDRRLRGALSVFEELGTPLWADRAQAQLAGADVTPEQQAG